MATGDVVHQLVEGITHRQFAATLAIGKPVAFTPGAEERDTRGVHFDNDQTTVFSGSLQPDVGTAGFNADFHAAPPSRLRMTGILYRSEFARAPR